VWPEAMARSAAAGKSSRGRESTSLAEIAAIGGDRDVRLRGPRWRRHAARANTSQRKKSISRNGLPCRGQGDQTDM